MSRRKPSTIDSSALHRNLGVLAVVAAIVVALIADDSPNARLSSPSTVADAPKPEKIRKSVSPGRDAIPEQGPDPASGDIAEPRDQLAAAQAVSAGTVLAADNDQGPNGEPLVKGMPRPGHSKPRRESAPSPGQVEALIAESHRNSGSEGRGD
jgi:hypothetical protein